MNAFKCKKANREDGVVNSGDACYEDDGFFSDVPSSGSLSKSLVALNKYVKKNLLYEDVDKKDDSAYFSKESSPNDSVLKSDSESLKSNESFETKESLRQYETTQTKLISPKEGNPNESVFQRVSYDLKNNESFEIKDCVPQYETTPKNASSPITEHKLEDETIAPLEQTDEYKCLQLQKLNDNVRVISDTDVKHYDRTKLQSENISTSFVNLSVQDNSDQHNIKSDTVVFREKSSDKPEENRHTVADFSEWGNRTTIYPDVYAPLPYKSPRRYVESDVNIHYRCPVRHDPLPLVPERELARQQAEHMKRLYREQKRNKYLQELQDMQSRRHQDNFLPSQKNILPLNRYDETERVVARALYAFNGQTARELSFRKGDIIHVRRQIDANWYEGELHGRIGLFPYNYIEIVKGDAAQSPRKPAVIEGRARAKFDFTAQTNLELPLKKGELVVLTRRIDHNWWEGRLGNKTGIFPDSYVTILQEPSQTKHEAAAAVAGADKPAASPAAHGLVNGAARRSLAAHSYTPQLNSPALSNAPPATQPLPGYVAKPAQATLTPSERGYGPPAAPGVDLNNREPLYVDTNAEAVPYRAMYKYRPQNPDELELNEGDTVYVLEQCDDGWYVGSSQRTGRFGTFPGNYVERI